MQNDILLQQTVLAALELESSIGRDTIGVEVHHGVVKLAGCVNSQATKQRAELLAQNVAGVNAVVLDLDVTADTAPPPPLPTRRIAESV